VSSLAVWVAGAFLKARGLWPLLADLASSRPITSAAAGLPVECLRSKASDWAMTLAPGVSLERLADVLSLPSRSCWFTMRSSRGATGLDQLPGAGAGRARPDTGSPALAGGDWLTAAMATSRASTSSATSGRLSEYGRLRGTVVSPL
jgi:hypothetical protein